VGKVALPAGDDFATVTVELDANICGVDVATTVVPNCTIKLIGSSGEEF
jgi:hypothetical protein